MENDLFCKKAYALDSDEALEAVEQCDAALKLTDEMNFVSISKESLAMTLADASCMGIRVNVHIRTKFSHSLYACVNPDKGRVVILMECSPNA